MNNEQKEYGPKINNKQKDYGPKINNEQKDYGPKALEFPNPVLEKEIIYTLIFNDKEYETNNNKLDKIPLLKDYISKNPTIYKIKINNLLEIEIVEELLLFIINYAELYPKDKEEELIMNKKNNSRNIKNLLNENEFNKFNSILNTLEIKKQIRILLKLSEI